MHQYFIHIMPAAIQPLRHAFHPVLAGRLSVAKTSRVNPSEKCSLLFLESAGLPACDVVLLDEWFPTFRRKMSPSLLVVKWHNRCLTIIRNTLNTEWGKRRSFMLKQVALVTSHAVNVTNDTQCSGRLLAFFKYPKRGKFRWLQLQTGGR